MVHGTNGALDFRATRIVEFADSVQPVHLTLFPGLAVRADAVGDAPWVGTVQGVAVRSRRGRIRRRFLIRLLARLMDTPVGNLDTELCRIRTEPFFLRPARVSGIQVEVESHPVARTIGSRRNGHFQIRVDREVLPELELCRRMRVHASFARSEAATSLHMLEARGLSVISDIDDTIKESDVENRAELLANTFLREFREIAGMSGVYRSLWSAGASFHYVTASPWQLCEPLLDFLELSGYPGGSMHFRRFRLSDHLLKRLGVIHRGGKSAAVRRILASCPHRSFVLIGDSGEKDPQIYARCFRDHPRAIRRILIRLVRPGDRFRESILRARIGLPGSVFSTFETAEQLGNLLVEPF